MSRITNAALPPGTTGLMENNLHRALANNPAMAPSFYGLANAIHAHSHLPQRVKELAILRVAAKLGSDFEFSHHFRACPTVGLTVEDVRAARDGDFTRFSAAETAALALTDAIDECRVDDHLWSAAAAHFCEVELLDLAMTVGFYGYASRLTVALNIAVDPGFLTIAES
jgi:4-carboxymuconolactone decarboxylase